MIEERATHSLQYYESQHENRNQKSTRFQFSLQILTREGFSVKGEAIMDKSSTTVPPRASRQPMPDIDQEYDDDTVVKTPSSVLRHRPIQQSSKQQATPVASATTPTLNTGPIIAPSVVPTRRVTGGTRVLLYVLLFLCIALLVDGIVIPTVVAVSNHFTYGSNQIASFDLDQHHFLTQETHNMVRITVTSADGKHVQVLTTPISGASDHALVTLTEDGSNIDVAVNGLSITPLVPDGHGMYQWKEGQ